MRKNLQKAGSLLLAGVLALGLAACAKKEEPAASGTPAGKPADKPLTELTVLLDWYPNAVHSFLFAAEEQGYFKEAGLKVNLQTPADTNDALKLLAADKADLAISYQMQVALSRAEGIPIVSVASIVRHPLNQVFASEKSGIKSAKDLAGHKVGYPSFPIDQDKVTTMVKADGGDPSKVQFIDVGYDLIPAMTTGKVDAIIGGYINHEKLLLEKEGIKLVALDPAKFGVPDYYELVLTASENGLKSKGDAIKAFWQAARKGQEYTAKNPDKALKTVLDKQNKEFELDPEIEKKSLQVLLPLMDNGKDKFGSQTEASWQSVIDWMKKNGSLKGDVKAADAFRNLE
ncbi:ABC transporter substrate-binding protein [Paenibacillus aurantius]|uniref:ABC transporter substrate-binding protein n=1 Tax=Paenibacillus aurantius TaxID=2918900 RepID=A0AA96REV0_9BACL|nr:ABC transporter substrate-binding protein [Paenibacillus aurantius]WNQ12850.1 ABC transporter substrate-binding protein [Paenibacillus aurantius]